MHAQTMGLSLIYRVLPSLHGVRTKGGSLAARVRESSLAEWSSRVDD